VLHWTLASTTVRACMNGKYFYILQRKLESVEGVKGNSPLEVTHNPLLLCQLTKSGF